MMQPTEGFWGGVGQAVGSSPGWMVVAALFVVGVLYIVARYYWPYRERIRTRELDIREREAVNDEERIKANMALAEEMHGMRESNDNLAIQSAAVAAGIGESRVRSAQMGEKVDRIDAKTAHAVEKVDDTNAKVTEMHQQTRDIYNMLNKRGVKQDAQ